MTFHGGGMYARGSKLTARVSAVQLSETSDIDLGRRMYERQYGSPEDTVLED
jgi:hypothetical protein